jgi:hypothetical protein
MKQRIDTTDIVLAATLRVLGYQLDRIEKAGNRGVFCFNDVENTILTEFDLGQIRIEPVAFNNAIKALTTAARRTN